MSDESTIDSQTKSPPPSSLIQTDDEETRALTLRETGALAASATTALARIARQALTPALREVVPMNMRIERVRMLRYPSWIAERHAMATEYVADAEVSYFRHELATHSSPLRRDSMVEDEDLQRGKEINVGLAADLFDGIVLSPQQVFSYHHVVGRPSYRRGFVDGPELRDGVSSKGVGGGCCQITNMLFFMALHAGLEIVERHRHCLDLFPDVRRTVPFGCGATVFYNQADLRLKNPFDTPVMMRFAIDAGRLQGALLSWKDPGVRTRIIERDHAFTETPDGWVRSNRICRQLYDREGTFLEEHEVLRNRAHVLYDPVEEGVFARGMLEGEEE